MSNYKPAGVGNADCVIVVPVHNPSPKYEELRSLEQMAAVIGDAYDISLVCPEGMDYSVYASVFNGLRLRVDFFPERFFVSKQSYNQLCVEPAFYERFIRYEYMLIYQTDCWIFRNDIDKFVKMGYDWYGAAWPHEGWAVGNGGFNLRKIAKCLDICKRWNNIGNIAEDYFFCVIRKHELCPCPIDVANDFSWESMVHEMIRLRGGMLPMGCHGWNIAPEGVMQWNGVFQAATHAYEKWYQEYLQACRNKEKEENRRSLIDNE